LRARGFAALDVVLVTLTIVAVAVLARPAVAQAVKGELTAAVENGYARLIFRFDDEVESQVRLANNILTVTFQRPVDVPVERISAGAPDYISIARRDPDGKGIRIALSRKVTMNSITVGERLFIDLLPDGWSGLAPGLPRDVIEELARRARDAEKRVRQRQALERQNQLPPVRVKAITQPTFTRYVFDLPELIGVTADNTRDKLTLTFDAVLRFDLADAKATLPSVIESIDSEIDHEQVLVRFAFSAKVDVRTFREEMSYVVDVESAERKAAQKDGNVRSDELVNLAAELAARKNAPPTVEAPKTVPARKAAAEPESASSPPPSKQPTPAQAPHAQTPASPPQATPPELTPEVAAPPLPAETPPPLAAAAPAQPDTRPAPPNREPDPDAGPRMPGETTVKAELNRNGETVTLSFPFAAPTPAAVFRRADTLWLVFETEAPISIAAINAEQGKGIRSASIKRARGAAVVRIKLERPFLISVGTEDNVWTVTLGNEIVGPTRPLAIARNIAGPSRSTAMIPIDGAHGLHRIEDPDIGDTLLVATALAPARGLLKSQDFVEFRALASAHGIALQPLADDLNAEVSVDKILLSRPTGLALSAVANASAPAALQRRQALDLQSWGFDRQANFTERNTQLILAAAGAPDAKRLPARCDLARFYLARDMFAEAKGVLDVALADNPATADDAMPMVLRAIASIMIGRADAALRDLNNPLVGNQHDAPLWRALANARLGKWTDAREGFRGSEAGLAALPLEFQRTMISDMLRAAIEVGDTAGAANLVSELELIGIPRELEPTLSVLTGRLAEALGRADDALRAYRTANDSWDRPAGAQGRLHEIQLEYGRGRLPRENAITDLESLTTIWRGDQTEMAALQMLARLYTETDRYRDAFTIMRTALRAHPNSDMTRRIQEEAISTFDSVYLAGKGDALPAIDALALFYDFRELTPIGRRGDEMIRRLADRLVSVDLLYQASELLAHQIEHRLQGAARAQVATRLAVVYLMDRKADKALATLRITRMGDLNNDLRNQRLLLEARALSDLGRHEVAIEVVENIAGREAVRLRSDILWAARKWAPAAEQIEALYGDRWQDFTPLSEIERVDILRAAIGYAMGEDAMGLARLRERYLSRMGEGRDLRAFEVVSAPVEADGTEFGHIARSIAAMDTLEAFLRDLRARYPETGALPPGQTRTPAAQDAAPPAAPAAEPPAPPGRSASG
jgi:tetratricopeptide (TPR) repeat protein